MTNIDVHQRSPSPTSAIQNPAPSSDADTDAAQDPAPTSPGDVTAKDIAGNTGPNDHAPVVHAQEEEVTPSLVAQPTDVSEPVPPEVESLKAMFPDFDVAILQSVLLSVGGDQERAADVLLGMSDPNYVSQQQSAPSQTDLDEELARRLMLEDEQQQAAWHPDQAYFYEPEQGRRGNVPYQPRVQGGAAQGGGQGQWGNTQGGNSRDTMTEVQEQFSKIAETGKRTFSSLVTKVKAKMQELDQSRSASGSTSQTSWGAGTPSIAPPSSQPQGQYYAGSGQGDYGYQGYDAAPQAQPAPTPAAGTGSTFSGATSPPANRIPQRPSSTGPPPSGNVDPTKIGMLPKRAVSLLVPAPAQSSTAHKNDDDDNLDYVENPFEDGRK